MRKLKILSAGIMLTACCFWSWIFKDFLSGSIPVNGDTNSNYLILKYFFNSVLNGTLPLWDPYTFFGRHFLYTFSSCALNPFAWSIPLGVIAGLDYYQAYLFFIVGYFFLGCFGFFYLVKLLLEKEWIALLGFGMILTSGLGPVLFKQILIVYLFVPAVWFFVFWVRFFRTCRVFDFWGMVLCAMTIAVSYLPFYFITLFLFFILVYGLLFAVDLQTKFGGLKKFVLENRMVVGLGLCAVIIALIPLILFKVIDAQGDIVSLGRHNCPVNAERPCMGKAELGYLEAGFSGSLAERMMGLRAYSDLDKISYNSDDFFYVSVVSCFLILVSAVLTMTRFRLLIFILTVLVFFTALGAVTPLHYFLYDHVGYFRFFRNIYFFSAFLIPLLILFSLAQLKDFIREQRSAHSSVWVLSAAGLLIGLLSWHGRVLMATYLTVLGTALIIVIHQRNLLRLRPVVQFGLIFLLMLFEPWQIMTSNVSYIPFYTCRMPKQNEAFVFSYHRPLNNNLDVCLLLYRKDIYSVLRLTASLKDSSGFYKEEPDFVMKGVDEIADLRRRKAFTPDVHVKLSIYDEPAALTADVERIWNANEGVSVDGNGTDVRVSRFDANHLMVVTNFKKNKFLLYRDAYSSDWKVFVDGRQAQLHRVSRVFKGVSVPEGKHVVDFRYSPVGGVWIYWAIVGAMFLVISGMCVLWFKDKKRGV